MRRTSSGRRRRSLTGLLVGLLLGSAVFGGGTAWAYWTASASATAQVTTPVVRITQSNFPALFGSDFINTHSSLSKTGSFTIKNESTAAGTASLSISAPGALAPKLPLVIWPVAAATVCEPNTQPGAGAVSANWSALSLNLPGSLAADASQKFCVRTTVADRSTLASTQGTLTAEATLTAKLDVAGWVATDTSPTATQRTADIFPAASDYRPVGVSDWFTLSTRSVNEAGSGQCLDAAGSATGNGTAALSYNCSQNDNQAWQIRPVSGSNPQTVTLRPMHAYGRNLDVSAAGAMNIQTASAAGTQRWMVQKATGGTYQLVSASTGKCVQLGSLNVGNTVDCTVAGTKIFLNRLKLTATKAGNSLDLTLPIKNISASLVVQHQALLGWTTTETLHSGPGTVSFTLRSGSYLVTVGDINMRIVMTTGTSPVAEDIAFTFVINRSGLLGGPLSMVSGDG